MNASAMKLTAKPTVNPRAASESIHAVSSGAFTSSTLTTGHCGARAIVSARHSIARGALKPVCCPGNGTKTNTALRRVSTSRNPTSVESGMTRSPRIAAQVAKERRRVAHQLCKHPRQKQQEAGEEGSKPRNRAERGVLQRRRDLNDVDRHADDYAKQQER